MIVARRRRCLPGKIILIGNIRTKSDVVTTLFLFGIHNMWITAALWCIVKVITEKFSSCFNIWEHCCVRKMRERERERENIK